MNVTFEDCYKFNHSSNILVSGQSGSGKSYFAKKLLKQANHTFSPVPKHFYWFYAIKQQDIESELPFVTFIDGTEGDVFEKIQTLHDAVVVLDDLTEYIPIKHLNILFTVLGHHQKLSLMYLCQNLFYKNHRLLSINSHYNVFISTLRDYSSVKALAIQLFASKFKYLLDAINDCQNSDTFFYLILNSKAGFLDNKRRLYRGIFSDERLTAYEIK